MSLGANWRTSLSGLIGVTATVIAATPALVEFLPDGLEGYVKGIAGLIAAVSAYYFVFQTKDKQVTGGTVAQTSDGLVAAASRTTSVVETTQATPK